MELSNAVNSRRSIRKWLDKAPTDEDIVALIDAARHAPSGCNSQNWHFIAVRDRELIDRLAAAAEKDVREFYSSADEQLIRARIGNVCFFRNAPLVIFVYTTPVHFFDPRVPEYYASLGMDEAAMNSAMGHPDLLGIGAAVENLLLTAVDRGLGAVWMVDPLVAERGITDTLGAHDKGRLISVIPVGTPAYTPGEKPLRPLSEILEIR